MAVSGTRTPPSEQPESAASDGARVRTSGHWIDPDDDPLHGWLSSVDGRCSSSGVLILPPIGYPYWSAYRTGRVIAERVAAAGHLAFRLDYRSSGDSSGDQWDAELVASWGKSIARAARELRRLGCTRLTLVGIQLGGTLALLGAEALEADTVVAWAPVVSGRRYAREIRARSVEVPRDALPPGIEEAMVLAGTVFTTETLGDLATLEATKLPSRPARRTLLVDGVVPTPLLERLTSLGAEVDHREIAGGESALEWPAEDAVVPTAVVHAICSWIGEADRDSRLLPPETVTARIAWGGSAVAERVVELGAARLVAILTEPVESEALADDPATVVFLNSGGEQHTGPGRAWVEYARGLALRGHRCLRVDYRGWGESPDDGHAPGRLYAPHCERDTVEIVRALQQLGFEHVVLVGLCHSAWMALRAVLTEPADGVVALNPQMYWRQGDPVEALITDTRTRRTNERLRHRRGARVGLWTALDIAGHRPWGARWLDELSGGETPIAMLFAEGDDGIDFLRTRLDRRLRHAVRSGRIRVVEIPEIDHAMHRTWLRPKLVDILDEQIRLLTAAADAQS